MTMHNISGKKVAFLLTDGVEQVELTSPWEAVKGAGGVPTLVAPGEGSVQGFNGTDKGDEFPVDLPLSQAKAEDFDALVLPGGVVNGTICGWIRTHRPSHAVSLNSTSP